MGTKRKRELGELRLAELISLATQRGFKVHRYSFLHWRILGNQAVDCWPTTGRAWVVGGKNPAAKLSPVEAVELARSGSVVVDEVAARSHMQSIATEDSEVPW